MELAIHLFMFLFLIFFTAIPSSSSSSSPKGLRLDLSHVDSHGNFSKLELLQRAAVRSRHRMSRLVSITMNLAKSSATAAASESGGGQAVQTQIHAGSGEFLIDLAIGTPSVPFSAIADTGSDLVWTQCKPCVQCFSQPSPVFDPSSSSTYAKLSCSDELCQAIPTTTCWFSDCEYSYRYGDSSSTRGVLSSETLTFGSDHQNSVSIPRIVFGCGDQNRGVGFSQGSGIVGLGRGPLSLISQLGFGKFSYCLTSLDESKKSPLLLGSSAQLVGSKSSGVVLQSTPLVKNPNQPSFYYLSLKDISVGGNRLQIPPATFAVQADGTGGLIIDSGTSITYLESAGYAMVKAAFLSQMQLPAADGSQAGLDLCFSLPEGGGGGDSAVEVPKLVLHFDGADLELPGRNYMVMDSSSGLLCLTVLGSTGLSILGNFQQQNLQILYDLTNEMLSFLPVKCDQLI